MGVLYPIFSMNKQLTKKQILEITGIGKTKCNEEINTIKSHYKFSSYTQMNGVRRVFDENLLNYFFTLKIKPRNEKDNKKFRSFIKSKNFNYIGHITLSYNLEDTRKIGHYFRELLEEVYGKKSVDFYFWMEIDPILTQRESYHLHFVCSFNDEIPSLQTFKSHFTEYLESRVGKSKRIEIYDYYDKKDKKGVRYVMKMGLN
jgi:hypothetical protein